MIVYKIFFAIFVASIPILAVTLIGRHLWLLINILRSRHVNLSWIPLLAIAVQLGLFVAVGFVWFGYGVGHGHKDIGTDLLVILFTGVPSYGLAYGLWRLARSTDKRLTSGAS